MFAFDRIYVHKLKMMNFDASGKYNENSKYKKI